MIDFARHAYCPVIDLPDDYVVFDHTAGYDPFALPPGRFGVGRYDEKRPGMYSTELFAGVRDVHMGVDIGCPVGTPVRAFHGGSVYRQGYLAAAGDYGHVIVTHHRLDDQDLWALHGHLDAASISRRSEGDRFAAGEVLGHVGDRHENGGWNPHLHFQLSLIRPETYDLPGVVAEKDRAWARDVFPDPRLVLGQLYE